VNDQPVIDAGEVRNSVGLLRVGSKVTLQLLRDGKPVTVTLATMEPKVYEKDNLAKNPFLYGAGFRAFEEMTAGLITIKGVMLLQTNQEGAIWRAGLRPGDVILSANGVPVTTLDGLLDAAKKNKDLLLLNVFRGGGAMYVVVK
jgi:serine protease Do